jgi:hypothetical protein
MLGAPPDYYVPDSQYVIVENNDPYGGIIIPVININKGIFH